MNVEKLMKLVGKIGALDERIDNLTGERDELRAEAQELLGGGEVKVSQILGAKTSTGSPKNSTPLGTRIFDWLAKNPGSDLATIAQGVKEAAQRVGLSIYHLTNKGQIYSDSGLYYPTPTLNPASKTSGPSDLAVEVADEDEDETPF